MRALDAIGHALGLAGSMTWQVTWSLILGFTLSAVVQAVVRRGTIVRLLGDDRPKTLAVASALGSAFPNAPVVRVHTDCFAALLVPSSGIELAPEHLGLAAETLRHAVDEFRARETALRRPVEFTLSAVRLVVLDPSHGQLLGPLLWAEIERAHVMSRRGLASGIQERTLRLDGRV